MWSLRIGSTQARRLAPLQLSRWAFSTSPIIQARNHRGTSRSQRDRAPFPPREEQPLRPTFPQDSAKGDENQTDTSNHASKKRYALIIAYSGKNYQGLQLNQNIITVEGAIHEALYQLEWIPPLHYEQPTDLHYNRCSRTDKGVHALFNVVSMKFRLPTSNLQEGRRMLNEKLPEDIRILDVIEVPKGFNPKNYCSERTYEYCMPVEAFRPSEKHPEYDTLSSQWKFDHNELKKVNQMIGFFRGSNFYHNFTRKLQHSQESARRNIISFTCPDIIQVDGMEFVRFVIVGQSFLYHQIRKMVGLVASVYRDGAPWEIFPAVHWSHYGNWLIPLAPAQFLSLIDINFDRYNNHIRQHAGKELLFSRNYHFFIRKFQQEQLYSHYVSAEKSENLTEQFLRDSSLQMDYDYFLKPWIEQRRRPAPAESLKLISPRNYGNTNRSKKSNEELEE